MSGRINKVIERSDLIPDIIEQQERLVDMSERITEKVIFS